MDISPDTAATTQLNIATADFGNGAAGPAIVVGRNSNATNTGAGSIDLINKNGTAGYIWQDASSNVRINTAAPTNANDTAGTVIGTQTSSLDAKNVIGEFTDYHRALEAIMAVPLYNFTYKSGAFNNQEFTGIVTDYSPTFGMDRDAVHPAGKSLNVVTGFGYTFAAIKELSHQNAELKTRISELDKRVLALEKRL